VFGEGSFFHRFFSFFPGNFSIKKLLIFQYQKTNLKEGIKNEKKVLDKFNNFKHSQKRGRRNPVLSLSTILKAIESSKKPNVFNETFNRLPIEDYIRQDRPTG
jgi:hypothetical protein